MNKNEFIIKHNDFYNSLNEDYQELIRDNIMLIEDFGDLEMFETVIFDIQTWNNDIFQVALYLGKRETSGQILKYYYVCDYNVYKKTCNLKNGKFIIRNFKKNYKDVRFINE